MLSKSRGSLSDVSKTIRVFGVFETNEVASFS